MNYFMKERLEVGERVSVMKISKNVFNNQSGFTLLETLFSIMLITLIMSILPFILQTMYTLDSIVETDQDYEWNLFIIGLRKELREAEQINVLRVESKTTLILEKSNQIIAYEPYGRSIRRNVNKLGHEIVLQKIHRLDFILNEEMLQIKVEFIDGLKDETSFTIKEAG